MRFEIGQKVVCIKSAGGDVVKGKTFTIRGMKQNCCSFNLDIGIDIMGWVECSKCGKEVGRGVWWLNSNRFVPLEEWEQAEEAVESLLIEIDEELLVEL